jgi:hypothetical protein
MLFALGYRSVSMFTHLEWSFIGDPRISVSKNAHSDAITRNRVPISMDHLYRWVSSAFLGMSNTDPLFIFVMARAWNSYSLSTRA